jgi:hypothetical protein
MLNGGLYIRKRISKALSEKKKIGTLIHGDFVGIRTWMSSAVCALFKSVFVMVFKLHTEDTETILSVQYSVSMVVWVAASENARKEATVTNLGKKGQRQQVQELTELTTTCFRIPGLATFSQNKGPRTADGEAFSLRDAVGENSCRRHRDCQRNVRGVCEN